MSEGNENRLWEIKTGGERDGVALAPIAVLLLIGAAVIGFLTFPCIDLRVDFLLNAPEDAPMSFFAMKCEGEGVGCVCTQEANNVQGGKDCEFGQDLVIRCETVGAEEIR